MSKASRDKGRRGQREAADMLRSRDWSVHCRLTTQNFWSYNPITSKEVRVWKPVGIRGISRTRNVCGFFVGTSYGGADGGAQAPLVFAPRVPQSSNPSALPPDLEVGRQSFNGTLEAIMANTPAPQAHIIQWIIESWEQENAQLQALTYCLESGLRPDLENPSDHEKWTEWRLAEVLHGILEASSQVATFRRLYVEESV